MAAPICLSARTFLNDLPADLRAGWTAFLDQNPAVEDYVESALPMVETALRTLDADGGPLLESQMITEVFFLPLLALLGAGAGAGAAGYAGYNALSSSVQGMMDGIEGKVDQMADSMGVPADNALRKLVKSLLGSLKDLGLPAAALAGVMKLFGANWSTVGSVVGVIMILYMLLQLGKSKGPEVAEQAAEKLATSPQGQAVAKKVVAAVPQGSTPIKQADKVVGGNPPAAAPTPPVNGPTPPARESVYRDAEKYLSEKYNMGLLELHQHLVEAHGRIEGTRRFRTVSRIAMAKALGR